MDLNIGVKERAYIQSESEFGRAKIKAFLETIMGLITGHHMHLLSFDEVVEKLRLKQSVFRGLQDIPIDHIVGSTGRYEDFTRHFLPRTSDRRDKERWRNIYTLAVTGQGFPPIEVYQIDQVYFVKDGNHRVSVARKLGWKTIQALVTELPSSITLQPDVEPDELLIKEECAYFLEKTQLDKTRPDSKERIDFTEMGSYQRLMKHIQLHRYLLEKERGEPLANSEEEAMHLAAADWYDKVYMPLINAVRETDIIEQFPKRSESDLYIWLIIHQQELKEQHQLKDLNWPNMVEEFLEFVEECDKEI